MMFGYYDVVAIGLIGFFAVLIVMLWKGLS